MLLYMRLTDYLNGVKNLRQNGGNGKTFDRYCQEVRRECLTKKSIEKWRTNYQVCEFYVVYKQQTVKSSTG